MKKAFTLTEILITLCITGIVASLIIPSMVKLRPDSTKIAYLKIYDSLSNSIKITQLKFCTFSHMSG